MKNLLHLALFLCSIVLITLGCGQKVGVQAGQSSYQGSGEAKSQDAKADVEDESAPEGRKSSAKKAKKGDEGAKKAALPLPPELEECAVVAQHEGHRECDDGDIEAQVEAEQRGDVPAPAAEEEPATAGELPSEQAPEVPTAEQGNTPPAPPATPPAPPADPNIVEFRIKAGTGSNPWNTMAEMVVAKMGQTVRIVNDDTVAHRLHTNGAPCRHQQGNIPPGGSFDCVTTRTLDGVANPGQTYDHIAGEDALFYLTVMP